MALFCFPRVPPFRVLCEAVDTKDGYLSAPEHHTVLGFCAGKLGLVTPGGRGAFVVRAQTVWICKCMHMRGLCKSEAAAR